MNNIIYKPDFSNILQKSLIKKLVKKIFHAKPPQPRYTDILDISKVFRFIDEWGHNDHLSLKQLNIKVATILLLLSAERTNTLPSFGVKNIIID